MKTNLEKIASKCTQTPPWRICVPNFKILGFFVSAPRGELTGTQTRLRIADVGDKYYY